MVGSDSDGVGVWDVGEFSAVGVSGDLCGGEDLADLQDFQSFQGFQSREKGLCAGATGGLGNNDDWRDACDDGGGICVWAGVVELCERSDVCDGV